MARADRQGLVRKPQPGLTPDTRVAEAFKRCPQAVMVFVRRRMACPGCELNAFETLAGAAASYGVEVDALLDEIANSGCSKKNERGSEL